MPTLLDEDLTKDGIEALSSRPFRNVSRQTSRQMSLCGTPEKSSYRQLSVSDRSSIRVEEIIPAARVAIQVSDLCIQAVWHLSSLKEVIDVNMDVNMAFKELPVSKKETTSAEMTVIQGGNHQGLRERYKGRTFAGLQNKNSNRLHPWLSWMILHSRWHWC